MMATSNPQEGGTDTILNNPTVTHANQAADATEPKANPNGLDGHRDDKQLMASHKKVDEENAILAQTSGCFSVALLSKKDDANVPKDQDKTSTEDASGQTEIFYNPSQQCQRENKVGAEESHTMPKEILTEGEEGRIGTEGEIDCYPQQVHAPTNYEHGHVNETHSNEKCLNDNFTKYNWKRSVTEETQPELEIFGETSIGRRKDEIGRIATDIEQGEELLQRLQHLQLQQDLQMAKCSHGSGEVVQEVRGERHSEIKTEGATEGEEMEERKAGGSDVDHEERDNWMDGEENESVTVLEEPQLCTVSQEKNEDSFCEDDLCDSRCLPVGAASPAGQNETIPSPFLRHKLSAAETAIEKQVLFLAAQETHKLQRVDGVCNLAGNADVLEIPFKTDIVLDIAPVVPSCHRRDSQFSEQKMRTEINQDIQRELTLVNQGKIPGEYSKGEARQFKETKLLFEAIQQCSIEGPIRRRKSPTLTLKNPIYPSVLERTRSLEFFSLKSRPISGAQSLRFYKSNSDMERGSRSRGMSKTCLHVHHKEDKNMHLHRITNPQSANTTILGTWKTCHSKTALESHIQSENPFYKLRPALVLQPEVERDIREAKEREEELHRRRCALYGENRQRSEDAEVFQCTPTVKSEQQTTGKLKQLWPPPSTKEHKKLETSQNPKLYKGGDDEAPLWQHSESDLVNQPSEDPK